MKDLLNKPKRLKKNRYTTIVISEMEKTIPEWAKLSGISEPTIRKRLNLGISGKELLTPTSIVISYDGKSKTIKEWSEETGISYATLYARYKDGKQGEELFAPCWSEPDILIEEKVHKAKRTIKQFIQESPKHKRLHNIWSGIKARCYYKNNKDFPRYGEKGIEMDEKWRNDFFCFFDWAVENGYQNNLTVMRINRKGHYEPSNCKWATWKEQQNTRTNNVKIEVDGVIKTLSEWSRETGASYSAIKDRMNKGKSGKELFTTLGPKITYQGEEKSISEWSEITGIHYHTLITRYYRGKSEDEIFKPAREKAKANRLIEIDGVSRTLKEWAIISNLKYETVRNRYKVGKKGEELIAPLKNHVKEEGSHSKNKTTISQLTKENPEAKKLYQTWKEIRKRCRQASCKDYPYYGGKGITVYPEWEHNFWSFYQWSLDHEFEIGKMLIRRDKKGHYHPENCEWKRK